ncbi:catalase [Pleurocapsa sp. CCALA 161]|uniref:manganese catalase family protein n=1 Tax=Pleurocapsa sp. CCALA 161 TaxID=2107688 RepID=UPI000D05C479|nr:manganese catalase family protein [Pleurocapsa sp. CCALA 161]PSB12735.1 catalase [Pleurocapsa sp. CCALA 161]
MFFHKKELISKPINVKDPNPRFAQLLLEQFGGATGELSAALQYWVQSFHTEDPGIKDMLQDIAIEEFSHLEMIGKLIEVHTKNADQTEAYKSTLFAVRGAGPHFLDSQGSAWNANYINEGGHVVRDLRANIAAEAGARQTYESLIKIAPDEGTKETLVHLLTREISHTKMFMKALDSLGKLTDPFFGNVQPDETVDIYYNLSTSTPADDATVEVDQRGPWNSDKDFRYIADPMKEKEEKMNEV